MCLNYYSIRYIDSVKPCVCQLHVPYHACTCLLLYSQVTKLGNGVTVASIENGSFLSNIGVFVRAGSRYETYGQIGLTHLLRSCAFLVC